eukprot:355542-Chlamydomonas_euryale.AAC.4
MWSTWPTPISPPSDAKAILPPTHPPSRARTPCVKTFGTRPSSRAAAAPPPPPPRPPPAAPACGPVPRQPRTAPAAAAPAAAWGLQLLLRRPRRRPPAAGFRAAGGRPAVAPGTSAPPAAARAATGSFWGGEARCVGRGGKLGREGLEVEGCEARAAGWVVGGACRGKQR